MITERTEAKIDWLTTELAKLRRRAAAAEHRAEQAEAELARLSPLLQAVTALDPVEVECGYDDAYNRGCGKLARWARGVNDARLAL